MLKNASVGDIPLFWGLLWGNTGGDWSSFSWNRGWYLLGTWHIEEIAEAGQSLGEVSNGNRSRAERNAHLVSGGGVLPPDERVFLGRTPPLEP